MPIVKDLDEDIKTIFSQIDHLDTHLIELETEVTARYLLNDPAALMRLQKRLRGWKLTKTEYGLSPPFKITATFTRKRRHG
ncbi:hypothetical protein A7A09_007270 [Paracoccus methylarcula]|uniref:Uncharacterized protein n=2 Tax=Paracoccus methylarcula TaxID=72022 RepID=A0A422QZF5_9RHOB|nr:hypothetical protein A7A09_007270 [Paracoccus methylarcula]